MIGSYFADVAVQILFLVVLSIALNLLLGLAGQMSMATAALYGVGAYTCAILTADGHTLTGQAIFAPQLPFLVAVLLAAVVSFVAGLCIAAPAATRVRGEYLILLTFAFHFLFVTIVSTWVDLTGGPNGMVVPGMEIFGLAITTTEGSLLLVLAWAVIVALASWWIGASPFGRLLRGIREDEVAVQSVGKETILPKSAIFGLTAAVMGVTGALSAGYTQFVAPSTYSIDLAVLVAACVALGGPGNIVGSVVASIVIGSLQPLLENMPFLSSDTAIPWQAVIYGGVLVLGMLFRPAGLMPERSRRVVSGAGPTSPTSRASVASVADRASGVVLPLQRVERGKCVLQASNISKSFGGLQAVQNVDLELFRGEIVALIGPNGAGKTTVFNLITGAIKPDAGSVVLNGHDVTCHTPRQTAQAGMVRYFQDVRLFEGLSALENVCLGARPSTGEKLWGLFLHPFKTVREERATRRHALDQLGFVGASAYANELARNLSYGQQKLVAFARVLATGADVILLDEPTSGVDPKSADQIIELVRRLSRTGKTICIVEHSLHVVSELADRVVFMDNGAVVASGTVKEITTRPDLIELYFGT